MATNQFKTFADSGSAPLTSLSVYIQEYGARSAGNQNNTTADPSLNNRALHQATMVAEALGIMAGNYSIDFLDDNATNLSTRISSIFDAVSEVAAQNAVRNAINSGEILSGGIAHNTLQGRDALNAHPQSAITGLVDKLTDLQNQIDQISTSSVPDATVTVKGKARLATQNEVNTGLDAETIVTPASLRNTIFTALQIPNLSADKITSGTFNIDRIPNIDASKISSGTIDPARLPQNSTSNISASQITSGIINVARLPTLDASQTTSGVFNISRIPNIPASKITGTLPSSAMGNNYTGNISASQVTSGTLNSARIPGLDASKITSGTIDPARLPGGGSSSTGTISASQVVSGVFDVARIPNLSADKIVSGVLDPYRIPSLSASKISSDVFDAARIPSLDASKIATGTFNIDRIPELPASQITTGTIATARIPSLDASKITSGIFNANRIPYIDASKISSGVFNIDRIPDIPSSKIIGGGGVGGDIDASQVTTGVFNINRIPDIPSTKITGRLTRSQLPTDVTLLSTGMVYDDAGFYSYATESNYHGARWITKHFITASTNDIGAIEVWFDFHDSMDNDRSVDGNILTLSLAPIESLLGNYGRTLPTSDWGSFGTVLVYAQETCTISTDKLYAGNSLTPAQRVPTTIGFIYGYTAPSFTDDMVIYAKLLNTYTSGSRDGFAVHLVLPGYLQVAADPRILS